MDAVLSIVAPPPAGAPSPGILGAEAEAEGSFAAALTRSLATAEAGPAMGGAPAGAPPVSMETMPATPAALAVRGTAALAPAAMPEQPAITSELPAPVAQEMAVECAASPEAPAVASEASRDEPEGMDEEGKVEPPPVRTEAEAMPLLPPAGPAQPPRIPSPMRSPAPDSSGEDKDETAPLVSASPLPPARPVATPGLPTPDGAARTSTLLDARPLPVMAALREQEATLPAPAAGPPVPAKPLPAEAHTPSPEYQAPPSPVPPAQAITMMPPTAPMVLSLAVTPSPIEPAVTAPPPLSPARQVSSVAIALAFAPGGSSGFHLSLDPVELGRVEIHVQREGDSHSVRVTAERPETLALLQRDRHELDRGLAEAGLRVDSAGIDFALDTSSGGGSGGFGQESGAGPRGESRSQAGSGPRPAAPEREAPPPRVLRSLLDLNI